MARAATQAAGGVHTLPEAEFLRLCSRARLPRPSSQVYRTDATGRIRWLDFHWERYRLTAEIDGFAHTDLEQWGEDMLRDAFQVADGTQVLRLPNRLVRRQQSTVTELVQRCLVLGGWSG